MIKLLLLSFALMANSAFAAVGTVQDIEGHATAATGMLHPFSLAKGGALENGMTVRTGDSSRVIMKFEDGQIIVLGENTAFRINTYRFVKAAPKEDNVALSLIKGSLRAISGLIGKANPSAFRIDSPTATIGIRGTDFMAATGSLYLQVLNGMVSATNPVGTATFSAGQFGFVSSLSTAPVSITASQLPAAVSASFSQLGSLTGLGATAGVPQGAGTSTSAAGSTSGSAGGLATAGVATGAAVVAGIAAVVSNTQGATGTVGTTGTTGTR